MLHIDWSQIANQALVACFERDVFGGPVCTTLLQSFVRFGRKGIIHDYGQAVNAMGYQNGARTGFF